MKSEIHHRRKGIYADITDDNALLTGSFGYPAYNQPQKIRPFSSFLTVNGDGSTSDLRVNGTASSPVDCYYEASATSDTYITTANVLIADQGATLDKFGALSALTNGIDLFYGAGANESLFASQLKTNLDFIRVGTLTPGFGNGTTAFKLNNAIGSNIDAYNPILDLTRASPPFGIKLDANSNQRLGVRIKDNLSSGLDGFNIIIVGFERFE